MQTFIKKIILLIIVTICVIITSSLVYAQTVDEIQRNISSTNDKIKKLELEIKQSENDLEKTRTLKKTLKNLIVSLDLTRKKLEAEIRTTLIKVDSTNSKIKQLNSEILSKERKIELNESAVTEALRIIFEYDERTLVETALSTESFSGLWSDLGAVDQFNDSVRAKTEALKESKSDLEGKQDVKVIEKKNLINLRTELSDRKKITDDNKKEKNRLLVQTNNEEAVFQKLLREKNLLKNSFEKEITDYESRLKFLLDPKSIPPRGTKIFSPPLESMYITQNFGRTSASGRLYASGTHNGTDFRARTPLQVKAMSDGVVAGTGDTDVTCRGASFGKWVLIRYKSGLAATFAHLSLIKVSIGDAVSPESIIGYTGNTGYSTGPHLHISVYANAGVNVETIPSRSCGGRIYTIPVAATNAYLDPMDYM